MTSSSVAWGPGRAIVYAQAVIKALGFFPKYAFQFRSENNRYLIREPRVSNICLPKQLSYLNERLTSPRFLSVDPVENITSFLITLICHKKFLSCFQFLTFYWKVDCHLSPWYRWRVSETIAIKCATLSKITKGKVPLSLSTGNSASILTYQLTWSNRERTEHLLYQTPLLPNV